MASLQGPASFEQWSNVVTPSLRKSYKQNFSLLGCFALFLFFLFTFVPNQCMSPSGVNPPVWILVSYSIPYSSFFWTLFGLCWQYSQSTVLYCTVFFFSFLNLSFCCLNSLMLVVSWSLLLLLSALFWFTATSFHLTVCGRLWERLGKVVVAVCPHLLTSFSVFYTIVLLSWIKFPNALIHARLVVQY